MHPRFRASLLATALLALPALAPAAEQPFESTYRPVASGPVLLRNATVLTGDGRRLDGADVLMRDGKVAGVGPGLDAALVAGPAHQRWTQGAAVRSRRIRARLAPRSLWGGGLRESSVEGARVSTRV